MYKKSALFFTKKIAVLNGGDFFGEMSLVFDDGTSASVKTKTSAEVFVLLKSSFVDIVNKNADLAQEIRYIAEKRRYETSEKM